MAPKGDGPATKKSREPNEDYDQLSQESQDIFDEIASLGYTPFKNAQRLWFARRGSEPIKDAIGPFDHIGTMRTAVKEDIAKRGRPNAGEDDDQPVDLDSLPPSDRLPGMEEPSIERLDRQADVCITANEKKKLAEAEFKDACDEMRNRMRDEGRKRYTRRGFSLVLEESEKLVIKKAEAGKPKNPSTKRNGKGIVNPDPVLEGLTQ